MISYAQNYEDVILARAFADTDEGFYVDVGAASPNEATVTRHFYEAGWHGVNIEPLPEWSAELRAVRMRDFNLQAAAGAIAGEMTLYTVEEDPSLSTLSEQVAARHRSERKTIEPIAIRVVTLNEVLEELRPERVDFLKIDVEGAEAEVLRGIDLSRWRPRVIVVEATEPYSLVPTYQSFEPILEAGRYVFASTDGINRYYVREEEQELAPLLVPANSLDEFISMREQLLVDEIGRLRVFIRHLQHLSEVPPEGPVRREGLAGSAASAGGEVVERADSPGDRTWSRVVVLSSPQTGAGRLAVLLASALGAREALAEHPADVAWDDLPDAGVLRLLWPRSEQLKELLQTHGFQRLTIARHPLDVLLSICRLVQVDRTTLSWLAGEWGGEEALVGADPTSEEFLSWATSMRADTLLAVSASWWADPSTIRLRYEELMSDPQRGYARLLELSGVAVSEPLGRTGPRIGHGSADLEQISGSWQRYLIRPVAEALITHHRHVFAELGYEQAPDLAALPTIEQAQHNWEELFREVDGTPSS